MSLGLDELLILVLILLFKLVNFFFDGFVLSEYLVNLMVFFRYVILIGNVWLGMVRIGVLFRYLENCLVFIVVDMSIILRFFF